jgi:hypothetical protein
MVNLQRDPVIDIYVGSTPKQSVYLSGDERLFDLQDERVCIMKTIRFTVDHLDLVIGAFQFAGADRIVRMVQDAVLKESQASDESLNIRVINRLGHSTPAVQRKGIRGV